MSLSYIADKWCLPSSRFSDGFSFLIAIASFTPRLYQLYIPHQWSGGFPDFHRSGENPAYSTGVDRFSHRIPPDFTPVGNKISPANFGQFRLPDSKYFSPEWHSGGLFSTGVPIRWAISHRRATGEDSGRMTDGGCVVISPKPPIFSPSSLLVCLSLRLFISYKNKITMGTQEIKISIFELTTPLIYCPPPQFMVLYWITNPSNLLQPLQTKILKNLPTPYSYYTPHHYYGQDSRRYFGTPGISPPDGHFPDLINNTLRIRIRNVETSKCSVRIQYEINILIVPHVKLGSF